MKNLFNPLIPSLIGISATITLIDPSPVMALSSTEIARQAREFVVMIEGREQGSGVIIAKNGNTYTVLTNWHVMDTMGIDPQTGKYVTGNYEIVTNDGERHIIDDSKIKRLEGYDLATVEFNSSRTYTVAPQRNTPLQLGETLYTAGFPVPSAEIPVRSLAFLPATITQQTEQGLDGYNIIHDRGATPGTSGGALLDNEGKLVGINGEAFYNANSSTTFGRAIPLLNYLNQNNLFAIPQDVKPPQDFLSLGQRKALEGKYQEAITYFNQALEANYNNITAYYERGSAYYYLKDYQNAINSLNEVLNRDSNNTDAYIFRGVSYDDLQQYERAITDLNRAIELNPNYAEAYINRGNSYNGLQQYERAITDYNRAIELNPNFALAYNNRGIVYKLSGNRQNALSDLRQAARLFQQQGNTQDYNNANNQIRELEN